MGYPIYDFSNRRSALARSSHACDKGGFLDAIGQKQIALMIAARGQQAEDDIDDKQNAMLTLLELGALDATETDPDKALVPDPHYPGYLRRDIGGKPVFVPFHLVKVSPATDLLHEVIEIGEKVQLAAGNPICISGSTTFLGVLGVVADLDYCEYYLLPGVNAEADISAATGIADLPLVWLQFDGSIHCAPWTCIPTISEAFCARPGRLKLDFMSCGTLGPMATTSVILPTTDGEDGCAEESFAYQEAVIGVDAPLRVLVRPDRFGAYLNFLRIQARGYVDGSTETPRYAIKALKRLLALKAALGDHDEVDAIVEQLNRPEIEEVVQRIRLDELLLMRPHLPEGTPAFFGHSIADLEATPSSASVDDVSHALVAAQALATALLEEAERDFAEYA